MSLSSKDYYFVTNRTTNFRYFVDNLTKNKYIFYPLKYETLTTRQIEKYEHKLTFKFLLWAITNKDKLFPNDYKIAISKVIDISCYIVFTLISARIARKFLFWHQFIRLESWMQSKNYDVKFWKSIVAYGLTYTSGFTIINKVFDSKNLRDLAVQYSWNFTEGELNMPQIQDVLKKCVNGREKILKQIKQEIKI